MSTQFQSKGKLPMPPMPPMPKSSFLDPQIPILLQKVSVGLRSTMNEARLGLDNTEVTLYVDPINGPHLKPFKLEGHPEEVKYYTYPTKIHFFLPRESLLQYHSDLSRVENAACLPGLKPNWMTNIRQEKQWAQRDRVTKDKFTNSLAAEAENQNVVIFHDPGVLRVLAAPWSYLFSYKVDRFISGGRAAGQQDDMDDAADCLDQYFKTNSGFGFSITTETIKDWIYVYHSQLFDPSFAALHKTHYEKGLIPTSVLHRINEAFLLRHPYTVTPPIEIRQKETWI